MYLRSTKRKNKDGSHTVEYYQLAHNERHPETRKPVARIIHNFGRADKLDREQLVRLCKSIGRVCGLEINDPLMDSAAIESETGLFEDFTIKKTFSFGCPMVVETLWDRLGIKKTLVGLAKARGLQIPYERALLAMTANRLCEPESKLGVWDRWISKVYLPSCQGLKLRHMYEAMDFLHEHADEVEETIFYKVADLFNLEVDLIFYDTTTASFHIDQEDDPERYENATLRKFGHAKEGFWAPQVVIALAVTREHREMVVELLERELKKHPDASASAQWAIELLASRRFKRYLRVTKSNKVRINRGSIKEAARYDGKWVLETNDDTISLEDAAFGYKGLMVIERCFRSLKRTQIKMTPMYHWATRRIESHVKICTLSLLIERIAELECGKPWHQIKRVLDGLQITEFFNLNYRVLMRNELNNKTRNILKSLKITYPKKVIDLKKTTEK